MLKTGSEEITRPPAVALLVFAELLRSFGARRETQPVWRISLFTNINLAIVVAISFVLQVWSHHNAVLAGFLKTSLISFPECLMLRAVGAIPPMVLEMVKGVRNAHRNTKQSHGT